MGQVSFADLTDGVIHTAAHHNTRFNALKDRINALESDNYSAASVNAAALATGSVTGPKIAMGSDAQGDILYHNGTSYVRLGAGTLGQLLKSGGASANPSWAIPADITEDTAGTFSHSTATFTAVTGLSLSITAINSTDVFLLIFTAHNTSGNHMGTIIAIDGSEKAESRYGNEASTQGSIVGQGCTSIMRYAPGDTSAHTIIGKVKSHAAATITVTVPRIIAIRISR